MIKIGIIGSIGRVGKLLVQNIIDETNKENIDKIDFLQLSVLHIKSPLSHNFFRVVFSLGACMASFSLS